MDRRRGDRRTRADAAAAAGLSAALERQEIVVLYQPVFAPGGALLGAEALTRWRHPARGTIGAIKLFAVAARAHRVRDVTRHVARTALAAAAHWGGPLRLSVNITPDDLAAPDFADAVASLLDEIDFAPDRLTLEITEQSLVAELESPAHQLERLAAMGVRIALDDFGAGFCNFGYLKKLPLHALKLDRSMVEGLENARDRTVLRGIVGLAHALGLQVIAEGIETQAQLDIVIAEGCDAWQGFLGARPMSGGDFARLGLSAA